MEPSQTDYYKGIFLETLLVKYDAFNIDALFQAAQNIGAITKDQFYTKLKAEADYFAAAMIGQP